MNIKLLLKVKQAILRHPKNVDMNSWFSHHDEIAACGTTGCIGGWVVALGDIRKLRALKPTDRGISTTEEQATDLLEIDEDQADQLFGLNFWPSHIHDRYCKARTREGKAKAMAEMIDWFIEHET